MKISYRKFQIITITILLFLLALSKSGDIFVRFLIQPKIEDFERRYNISIGYSAILLKGFNSIQIKGLIVVPYNAEPLFHANSFIIKINFRKLLLKQIQIKQIEANRVTVDFIKHTDSSNFDFIYRQASRFRSDTLSGKRDYAFRAERLLQSVFNILPPNAVVNDFQINYKSNDNKLTLDIPRLSITDDKFSMEIRSKEREVESEWICNGQIQQSKQKLNARLYTKNSNKKIALPFLEYKWGTVLEFDTLAVELEGVKRKSEIQTIQGKAGVKGLTVFHKRISPDTILLDRGFINYKINIGSNYLEVDKRTDIFFNKLRLNPYLKIERKNNWHITASLDKKDFPADDLFSSLPKGLFYNLEGLKTEGMLTYHFLLDVDMSDVENLIFESSLDSKNFRILEYGNTDLRKMNGAFTHTIYEKEKPVRTFILGSENPDFRPYHAISRYLPYAIMHSEDAGFPYHRGFIPDAFRRSLVQNIQERRFARGGSTLSMQLVKNVFLNRNKTVARKLEEILIVWLIETSRLTSKERMFEVYMNVIEWGPNIYGITEASRFYFAKDPSALTLAECIFLSYIIPAPKNVRWHFDGLRIKPSFLEFYNEAIKRMLQRGWISHEEAARGNPDIQIRGAAQQYLLR